MMKMKAARRIAFGVILLAAAAGSILLLDRSDRSVSTTMASRGALVDITGRALTENRESWQAALNVATLRRLDAAAQRTFLDALSAKLGLPADRIPRLDDRRYVQELHLPVRMAAEQRDEVQRWLAASEWSAHRPALLRFIAVPERVYPLHDASAALVGMVDSTGFGIEGLERALDRRLSAGESVRLTVDIDLQARISTLLEEVRSQRGMTGASAVVMDLENGLVATIASVPGFDPADLAQRVGRNVQLHAVTQAFQAGPMLEPFLMHGVFVRRPESDAALASCPDLVAQFAGHADVLDHLQRVGLLGAPDVDFPGSISTLVRRTGTEAELLRDLGNGAGIAPSLLQYSAALASLIEGVPTRPVRLVADSNEAIAPADGAAVASGASRLLRAALVERARLRSGDAAADFGGLWAAYRDRVDSGVGVGRAALALFTPADSPNYLVTVTLEGEPLLSEQEVLALGRRVLGLVDAARPAEKFQARRATSLASRS